MSEGPLVELSVENGLATVRLNDPRVRNALSPALVTAFRAAVGQVKADPSIRGAILCGTPGGAFSAGADLKAVLSLKDEEILDYFEGVAHLIWEVIDCPKPMVAALAGPAMGGGADVAVGCDLRVAAPNSLIAFPGLAFGLVMGTQRLAALIGPARAKQMVFLGKRVNAQEALEMGLVDQVADDPEASARELAREMAQRPPDALAMAKQLLKPAYGLQELLGPVQASIRHPEFLRRLKSFASMRVKPHLEGTHK